MKIIKFLICVLLFSISTSLFAQVEMRANKKGDIAFIGMVKSVSRNNKTALECIEKYGNIKTVKTTIKKVFDPSMQGVHTYLYHINDSTAIEIEFKYSYAVRLGNLIYNFSDFKHKKSKSKIKAIGILPLKYNETVKVSFTKEEYDALLKNIKTKASNLIKAIEISCVK